MIHIFQTGNARDIASNDSSILNAETPLSDPDFVHHFLSHYQEASFEAEDFKKYVEDRVFNALLAQYTMFLSVGSTSTQGWIKDLKRGGNFKLSYHQNQHHYNLIKSFKPLVQRRKRIYPHYLPLLNPI